MRVLGPLLLCCSVSPALADMVVATRMIRPQEILAAGDLLLKPDVDGGDVTLHDLIGQEARVALYPGRPVHARDVGPPTVIDRNQIVPLIYQRGGLQIVTEGRSLTRAGVGEYVRVMNLSSRNTVSGRVSPDGRIIVAELE